MCGIHRRTLLKNAGAGAAVAGAAVLLSGCADDTGAKASSTRSPSRDISGTTAVQNVRIFDGERVISARTVVIEGHRIVQVGGRAPSGATVVDASGATLLPGLIDGHTHTSDDGLKNALLFGVTTELEMQGGGHDPEKTDNNDSIADVRSAGTGVGAPGGHPAELFPEGGPPGVPPEGADTGDGSGPPPDEGVSNPQEAVKLIRRVVADGADYVKIMIEDGSVLGATDLPALSNDTIVASVAEAHKLGKMAVAHALTVQAFEQAIDAKMDGLVHLFIDRPADAKIVRKVADSKAFVTACLCLNRSIMGETGADFAADKRVSSRLSKEWLDTLRHGSLNHYPEGDFDDVLGSVLALHEAGVDILVGTDVSVAVRYLGGLAHGASVHHELQLLVRAGLTPVQALRAATSVPARRFGLKDRGRIAEGMRADLLLVDGDPTRTISDSLSIREVWRRGARQPRR
ncbi:amidohydrolase family protein [Streptomyces sp. SID3212]|uniref:amidohydrolase family protein n=1 Tax=Streptomyces sp. SID3212 TaxID=2690259 RepID=UPI00136D849C|nr:amidohydrolase family protein [Streptomyces sp. SID3212]MYV51076.1 amidohydrolase family protein [Streptomyces sp. SID3212]MYV53302.1 amidohydrolase family protein [Streptomyces sp. SID3212]